MLISILNPWIKLNSVTFLLYFKHNVLTHKAKDKTYCTWRQWWCRFPVITWPAGWGRGWGQNKIHTTECSRTAEHPTGEQTAAQVHELNTVHLQTEHQSLYKALTAWTLLDGDMEVNWLFGELCNLLPFNVGWFGTGAAFESFLTFWTSMTEGRKEAVFSSVMRGRGDECWCLSGCPVSPSPSFRSSSPTRCLWRRLYGALKFLMKASLMGRCKQIITSRITVIMTQSFNQPGWASFSLK